MTNKRHKQKTDEQLLQSMLSLGITWDDHLRAPGRPDLSASALRKGRALIVALLQRDFGQPVYVTKDLFERGLRMSDLEQDQVSPEDVFALDTAVRTVALAKEVEEPDVKMAFGFAAGLFVTHTTTFATLPALKSVILVQVINLVRSVGREKLLMCSECGSPFVKIGRREYCSGRCQNRCWMRTERKNAKKVLEEFHGKKR